MTAKKLTVREHQDRLIAMIDDLSNEELAAMEEQASNEVAFYSIMRARCRFALLKRLEANDVTELVAGHYRVTREKGKAAYAWDGMMLDLYVKPLLLPGEYEAIVETIEVPAHTEYKVATAKLNALAKKRGGALANALQPCVSVTYGADTVAVEAVEERGVPDGHR